MISSTHHKKFGSKADVVLPGNTQHVGQVESEVDDAPAGRCQVGTREQGADEETLHDGYHAERPQEQEHDTWVTVRQQVAHLRREKERKQR